MRNEKGFTLIELLIVVAIIAIIAAIAVPNLLQARMAANEAGGIASLRTLGSGTVAYSAVNSGVFGNIADMIAANNIDSRFATTGNGFGGYKYTDATAIPTPTAEGAAPVSAREFRTGLPGFTATAQSGSARYSYGMAGDMVVRYIGAIDDYTAPKCGTTSTCTPGDPVGTQKE